MSWHEHADHGAGTEHAHVHRHDHPYDPHGRHEHGWHGNPAACGGDDTFGEEPGPKLPSGLVPPQVAVLPPGPVVVRPYVPGMLVGESRGHPINVGASQYDYYDLLVELCQRGQDFVVVEQDMVPPEGSIDALFACPQPWCGHSYAVQLGDVVEIFGDLGTLGLTGFKGPAVQWLGLVLSGWSPITWSRLDGMVYRALRIAHPPMGHDPSQPVEMEGFRVHRHYPDAGHLHSYSGQPNPIPPLPAPADRALLPEPAPDNTGPLLSGLPPGTTGDDEPRKGKHFAPLGS